MSKENSIYVIKTGYIVKEIATCKRAGTNALKNSDAPYIRVVCEPGACELCQQYSDVPIPTSEGIEGKNLPPFHPNCKCTTTPWAIDPWEAENLVWARINDDRLTYKQKAQLLMDFYHITEFSNQFIRRILTAIAGSGEIEEGNSKIQNFFYILQSAPEPIGTEAELPGADVDFSLFRWEDYKILGAYNQKIMQDMAYTDADGFRRIQVSGINEDAYMAALGSYYLKEENGDVNPSGIVYRVYLSNGQSFYLVAGDMKSDKDTNPDTHQYTYNIEYSVTEKNTDVIEFIIDKENMNSKLWKNNFKGFPEYFQGEIIRMEKLPMTILN